MSAVRRYPLIVFFVLAYLFSWWPWPLYALGLSPGAIIGFGPFLAALAVLALTRGKVGILGLLKRMVRWRVRPVWYAVALLLPVAIALGATVLNVLLGAQPPSSAELGAWPSLIPTFFLLHPWHRRRLGGAGVAWVRPPKSAGGPLGAAGKPDLRNSVGLLAPAAYGGRGDPLVGLSLRCRPVGGVHVVVQQHQRKRAARHAVSYHEQHYLGRLLPCYVLRGRLG
jgi:hypothetical protein